MHVRRTILFTLLLVLPFLVDVLRGAATPVVMKVREQKLAVTLSSARSGQPAFDVAGRLRWEDSPASHPDNGVCPAGATVEKRAIHLAVPRVEEVRCVRPGARPEAALVGFDAAGRSVWRRTLGFRSGTYTFDELVVGASREGIVLNNLTVLAPATGAVVLPPTTHPVEAKGRPVPDHDFTQAAIYLPHRRAVLVFEADVTLLRRSGGIFLLDPKTGSSELLIPVKTTPLGGYWKTEAMALDLSGRYLLLAQRLAIRGPGGAAFAVLDLPKRQIVFEETFADDHSSRDLGLAIGDRGDVAFAFLDETSSQRVLVHYRLSSPGGRREK